MSPHKMSSQVSTIDQKSKKSYLKLRHLLQQLRRNLLGRMLKRLFLRNKKLSKVLMNNQQAEEKVTTILTSSQLVEERRDTNSMNNLQEETKVITILMNNQQVVAKTPRHSMNIQLVEEVIKMQMLLMSNHSGEIKMLIINLMNIHPLQIKKIMHLKNNLQEVVRKLMHLMNNLLVEINLKVVWDLMISPFKKTILEKINLYHKLREVLMQHLKEKMKSQLKEALIIWIILMKWMLLVEVDLETHHQ